MAARRALGWVLALGVGVSGVLAPAARAATQESGPPSVRIAGSPLLAGLSLVGASEAGVAVLQGTDPGDYFDSTNATVFTGPEDGELTARSLIRPADLFSTPPMLLGVAGNQLGWAEQIARYGETNGWYLHRLNIEDGSDVIDAPTAQPAAFTGDSWYTTASFVNGSLPEGTHLPLLRHLAGTGTGGKNGEMMISTLLAQAEGTVDLAADGSSVLLAIADPKLPGPYDEDTVPPGTRHYRVVLIDLESGASQTLTDSTDVVGSVALGPDLIAWDSQAADGSRLINSRSRSGNEPIAAYPETASNIGDLVAGTSGVGYLVTGPVDADAPAGTPAEDVELRIVKGDSATTTQLPDFSSGLAVVDERFLTAAGGGPKVAGVYSVVPGDQPVRTATVPVAGYSAKDLALAGGKLYYLDRSPSPDGRHSVWKVSLSGTVGKAKRLGVDGVPLGEDALARSDRAVLYSAGRGMVRGPGGDTAWQLLDRGKVTATVQAGPYWTDQHPAVSGPYAIVDRTVFRPNGTPVYQVRTNDYYYTGRSALFGSTIVFSTDPSYHEDTGGYDSEIWLDDVDNPEPELLTTKTECGVYAPRVAVWGDTAAWDSCTDDTITVRNLRTGQDRLVATGVDGLSDLELGEGVLFWSGWTNSLADGVGGRVLDLADPGSEPVGLEGDWSRADLDDHSIARALDGHAGVEVQRLPFTEPYRPRLIGKVAAARFTAGTDTWRPWFDVSKPLAGVQLVITDAQDQPVRTLTGTGPDGSIRDVAWDGRDRVGRKVAAGLYQWHLTAEAVDGDGALIGKHGSPVVTGSVRVN
jgi:hypothetical protein